ncbi:Nif3-like dinuclear metal center hexameric protein [Sansalvadorimonas verongulae]|uniref:Nif3-like dinuclear metal center hexameric protein n=1 Tax=Sansalvadorimonas verongulae TaxID=2172824 RepID=UPI0012BD294C|nr:YqfO family protein [Sansalvadorimonas verongulae]MTI12434.1 NGG1p interacting factor NIF3 [Sansalvadorimonas verongulae]
MFKFCFFVPEENLEGVKEAVFTAGAGRIGSYDKCCWQVKGVGQFRPLEGSNPHIGQSHRQEQVEEFKVEMVCADDVVDAVIAALHKAHPYETPAFEVWRLDERSCNTCC